MLDSRINDVLQFREIAISIIHLPSVAPVAAVTLASLSPSRAVAAVAHVSDKKSREAAPVATEPR